MFALIIFGFCFRNKSASAFHNRNPELIADLKSSQKMTQKFKAWIFMTLVLIVTWGTWFNGSGPKWRFLFVCVFVFLELRISVACMTAVRLDYIPFFPSAHFVPVFLLTPPWLVDFAYPPFASCRFVIGSWAAVEPALIFRRLPGYRQWSESVLSGALRSTAVAKELMQVGIRWALFRCVSLFLFWTRGIFWYIMLSHGMLGWKLYLRV